MKEFAAIFHEEDEVEKLEAQFNKKEDDNRCLRKPVPFSISLWTILEW